jgi:multidrug resistance efflux pump
MVHYRIADLCCPGLVSNKSELLQILLASSARSVRIVRLFVLRRRTARKHLLKERTLMQLAVRVLLTLFVGISAVILGWSTVNYYFFSPWTRDARVTADVVTVAPDVSGFVTEVRVRNNQFVQKGDILFVIDQARYRLALADAEATLAARLAQKQMLQDQLERRKKLKVGAVIAIEDLDNAHRQAESAAAQHDQASAARDTAALNLVRTEVRASVNGYVTNLLLTQGSYASQGKAVLALIDSDSYRVDAYFEETKIPQIKLNAPADIQLMDGAVPIKGKVESIARGITDQDNKDGPQLLASVNPIFTWVRLAQRVPVRIRLTDVPAGVLVAAGMTCTVTLRNGV